MLETLSAIKVVHVVPACFFTARIAYLVIFTACISGSRLEIFRQPRLSAGGSIQATCCCC